MAVPAYLQPSQEREQFSPERAQALCAALTARERYTLCVPFNGEEYAAVHRLMFHWTLIHGMLWLPETYEQRWCYRTEADATAGLLGWQAAGWVGEPAGWERHPSTGRRRPGGDPAREYIAE